jgi:outer membrane protein OmpA-like peptidoglycan-associated protein
VTRPDLPAAFADAFNAEWQRLDGEVRDQAASRQRERLAIDRKIANLVDVISDGRGSPAILAKLKELEAAQLAHGEAAPPAAAPKTLSGCGAEMAASYAVRIAELTASLARGDEPEEPEIARRLIDQVIVYPPTDGDPNGGIAFIGNLIDLLRAASLGGASGRRPSDVPDPVLDLFVRSIRRIQGQSPWPSLTPPRRLPRVPRVSAGVVSMYRRVFMSAAALLCLAGTPAALAQTAPGYIVFFPEWSAALDDSARAVIAHAAAAASKTPAAPVVITGYADHKGSPEANADLSQLRAQVVWDGLQAGGVATTRMKIIAAGRQAAAGLMDRRVEVDIGGGS